MLKKILLIGLLFFTALGSKAQTAEEVYNQYLDFNLARFQGEQEKLQQLGEEVLPNADKLPEKARANFYFSLGKVYEDSNQHNKAAIYYEKVAAAVPDYYVVHRALGYIYLEDVKVIEKQLNASVGNKAENTRLTDVYNKAVNKALPHLEKAQACDPSDDTLNIIKMLYRNINDIKGLNTLDARLKKLSENCVDILSDK